MSLRTRETELSALIRALAGKGESAMKKFVLAAFAALVMGAGIAPMANAATYHSGPYDNTANSLGGSNVITGGG